MNMLKAPLYLTITLVAAPAAAADRWEIRGDNGEYTNNQIQPGLAQEGHDLEIGPTGPDEDWYKVHGREGRSYEARVFGGGIVWKYPACAGCATFERIAADGAVLTPGDAPIPLEPTGLSVRWIADGGVIQWLRAKSGPDTPGQAGEKYDILVIDTSLFLPRFNNGGSQRTIVVLQNTRELPVGGRIAFHGASGALLHTEPFSISAHGSVVLDTSSLAPLQGQAGSAVIAHTGGLAALVGKGVALDPVTGFSFDTPLTGVSY